MTPGTTRPLASPVALTWVAGMACSRAASGPVVPANVSASKPAGSDRSLARGGRPWPGGVYLSRGEAPECPLVRPSALTSPSTPYCNSNADVPAKEKVVLCPDRQRGHR